MECGKERKEDWREVRGICESERKRQGEEDKIRERGREETNVRGCWLWWEGGLCVFVCVCVRCDPTFPGSWRHAYSYQNSFGS